MSIGNLKRLLITNDGNRKQNRWNVGTIVRLNQKTVTIKPVDGRKWRVSPHFLKKSQ